MEPTIIVRRYFHQMLAEAGIRRLRFHDLRHSTATILLAQGETVRYTQRQMRHSSASITLDCYAHILPDTGQQVTQRLDDTIFGKQTVPKVG
jgi:integrase